MFVALLAAVPPLFAQPALPLKDVMTRVERYVASYGERAAIVVGTERYRQESRGSGMTVDTTRLLVSEMAMVRVDSIHGWLGFRDVIEVDGWRVTDREDRLTEVLLSAEGRYDEARRLSDESARYNVGFISRNFNVPTSALFFFGPQNRERFKFRARTVALDGTWEIAFQETERPTLIRMPDGSAVPSSGALWVRPEDGVVLRTQLHVSLPPRSKQSTTTSGTIDVSYRLVEAIGMWLPASMDEVFEATRSGVFERITGHAEYSNYRQFTSTARIK